MTGSSVLINEYRADVLENVHRGYVCVVDDSGKAVYCAGDPEAVVYFRSSSKPIQALPVIMRGLDLKYSLTPEESVILSGSVTAEKRHVDVLESIFAKAGLSEEDLIMKPLYPQNQAHRDELAAAGKPMRRIYHNCTGKHAGLMMLQRELTGSCEGYWETDSAAQKEVLRIISMMSSYPESDIHIGFDGCGVPVFALPVRCIATAYMRLACPDTIADDGLRAAVERYVPLINEYNLMMRGTNYLCSLINTDRNLVAKGGACGVYGLGMKKERLGVSVKLEDGTEDTWPLIIADVFKQIEYGNQDTLGLLDNLKKSWIFNDNDAQVGHYEIVFRLR